MPKMHQVLAVAQGKKTEVEKAMGDAYKVIQKDDLFDGFNRTYASLSAEPDAEQLPPEVKRVQQNLPDVVKAFNSKLAELFDVIVTMDTGNLSATSDIVVDDVVLVENVPSTTLLFLLKELENVKTFVSKLPTPDPAEQWTPDANTAMLATHPTKTLRTRKVQKPIVVVPATVEHPAQVQVLTEDVVVGAYSTIKFTTRVPATQKAQMLARVGKLRDAVKVAKEKANDVEVERRAIGAKLLGFVFGDYAA